MPSSGGKYTKSFTILKNVHNDKKLLLFSKDGS